jgi:hypothetical protein
MNKYIIIVESGKDLRLNTDDIEDIQYYLDDINSTKQALFENFQNNIVQISTTSFLIKSDFNTGELEYHIESLILKKYKNLRYGWDFKTKLNQVYIFVITDFEFATFREKQHLIEYFKNK